ncbi:hypothetical protein OJAV_G00155360 [Oryzias javanicus]|uniref:Uncharacterized protein n=1 Tax=Oryzias javanicus TaxID=123683 RepID=A0A3S2LVS2_ORYJA|nr:hypothetical protein OJAV_G00155360 [Oryzias javanicus]
MRMLVSPIVVSVVSGSGRNRVEGDMTLLVSPVWISMVRMDFVMLLVHSTGWIREVCCPHLGVFGGQDVGVHSSEMERAVLAKSRARLEDRLYEHLEWSSPPRLWAHELLGGIRAGLEVGSTTPHGFGPGTALMRCGETQKQLGETERKFVQSTNIHFLTPLRSFTEGGYRAIQVGW